MSRVADVVRDIARSGSYLNLRTFYTMLAHDRSKKQPAFSGHPSSQEHLSRLLKELRGVVEREKRDLVAEADADCQSVLAAAFDRQVSRKMPLYWAMISEGSDKRPVKRLA